MSSALSAEKATLALIDRVAIAPWVFDALVKACDDGTDLETSGALAGVLLEDRTLLVLFASGAGEGARRQVAFCDYMTDALQGWLDALTSLYPAAQLCGLWHLHPAGAYYSATDAKTFANWVTDPAFNLVAAVFPILGRGKRGGVGAVEVYYADEGDPRPRPVAWEVLEWADARLQEIFDRSAPSDDLPSASAAQARGHARVPTTSVCSPDVSACELKWCLAQRGLEARVMWADGPLSRIDVFAKGRRVVSSLLNDHAGEFYVFAGQPGPRTALTLKERFCDDLGRCLGAVAVSRRVRCVGRWRRRARGLRPTTLKQGLAVSPQGTAKR